MDRLTDAERERMLEIFDQVTAEIPDRPRGEVDKELVEVGRSRRRGRRASGGGAGG